MEENAQPVGRGLGQLPPLHLKAKVQQIQAWIRQYVGEGVRINLEWERTGTQEFDLLGGDRTAWTMEAIYGRHGFVRASAPQSHLLIDEPELQYTVQGADILWGCKFVQRNGVAQLSPASNTVGAAAGPQNVVGSVGLMGVLSILSFAWQLLHPHFSLRLPGDLSCQLMLVGEQLTVDMLQPLAQVRLQLVWQFSASLSRITATPDLLGFDFVGSFLKHREAQLI